jgi:hypothetical protein
MTLFRANPAHPAPKIHAIYSATRDCIPGYCSVPVQFGASQLLPIAGISLSAYSYDIVFRFLLLRTMLVISSAQQIPQPQD